MLIIDKLKSLDTLSEAEISVADKLVELQDDVKHLSIRELAKLSFTSTSAVVRLCHKIGFEGYNDFKDKYIEEIRYLNEHFDGVDANLPFTKDDNLTKVISSISVLYQETAKDTLSLINHFDLIRAAKFLEKSRNIYVLCIGSALELGKIFADRMMRIGKNVIVSENVNEQYYQSYNALEDDCFIIVSYSGSTLKTKQFIDNLKKTKAKKILITSLGKNDMKSEVDITLTMTTRERLYSNIATYTSTVSVMLILDMLYSVYFHSHYDKYFEYKKYVAKSYEPNRKATHRIMEEDDENIVFKY